MHTYTQEQRNALIAELSVAAGLLSVGQVRDWDDLSETLKCAAHMLAAPSTSPDAQDAARYRWLRDNMNYENRGAFTARNGEIMPPMCRRWYYQTTDVASSTLDAVVDAAIKGGE